MTDILRVRRISVVKRLWCTECASAQDARRAGKSAEYTLDCGHTRKLFSSEAAQERNEEKSRG
jgi:hypothetical protein